MMPFAVIGAEDQLHVVQGRKVRGRAYPWGVCETDNAKHCDFARLRYVLFRYILVVSGVHIYIFYSWTDHWHICTYM